VVFIALGTPRRLLLYYVREFAAEDGALPQRFRALVDDVFEPLLRAR
jgi:hypothetical protein